jgi:arylsulfatase A-like enzyme
VRPNVVVFFTDQQRHDSTGLHGNPLGLTPNLDELGRANTHLFNSFTCQPVCGPARAAFQTGQFPTRTGHWTNGRKPLTEDTPALGDLFGAAGYDTAYIGKWHLGRQDDLGPVARENRGGYDFWLASNQLEMTSDAYRTTLYDLAGDPVFLPGYRVDALTDAAIRYVSSRLEPPGAVSFFAAGDQVAHPPAKLAKPFFLFVSFIEPHHQNHRDDYPAPDGYRERFEGRWTPPDLAANPGSHHQHLAGYWGMVKRIDEALGRLLDALRSMELLDDTIVLFTADHGCHFKTRNDEYKRSADEASIRVPTVMAGPGFRHGGRIENLVSLIDLPPTLLDACGLDVPREFQGRSLMPIIRGELEAWRNSVLIQVSESKVGRAVRTRRWKYSIVAKDADPWADSGALRYEEEALYDLFADPHELTNLIGYRSHLPLQSRLKGELTRLIVESGEPAPEIIEAPTRESGQRKVFLDEVEL